MMKMWISVNGNGCKWARLKAENDKKANFGQREWVEMGKIEGRKR